VRLKKKAHIPARQQQVEYISITAMNSTRLLRRVEVKALFGSWPVFSDIREAI
jgi:hypothetical protein